VASPEIDPVAERSRALDLVYRNARSVERAQQTFHQSIRAAARYATVREIARASGLAKSYVHRIIREEK